MNKIYTVAIIGVGARGGNAYGKLINKFTDKYDIVALCDLREDIQQEQMILLICKSTNMAN